MTIATLLKRIERIEAKTKTGTIRTVAAGRPVTAGEVAEAVTNWREWVADGRASRWGDTLYIRPPALTLAEWTASVAPQGTVH